MLSLAKGDEIATVTAKKKKFNIFIYGKDKLDDLEDEPPHLEVDEPIELLDDNFYRQIPRSDKKKLMTKLSADKYPFSSIGETDLLYDYQELANEYIDTMLRKQLHFDTSEHVFPIPQLYSERLYISAPSGAGKSYFTGEYIEQIRTKFGKKRQIYIFSRVDEDKALDRFPKKSVTRIPLEAKLWSEVQFSPEDFKKGICVFDDIDTIQDRVLAKKVQLLRGNMLETGRHSEITVISTSHQIQNFMETRQLINEAQYVVLFPRASSIYHISNFLEKYLGLNSYQIKQIYKLPTRWIFVSKQYPRYLLYQHGAMLL